MKKIDPETLKEWELNGEIENWLKNVLNHLEEKIGEQYSHYIYYMDKNTGKPYIRYNKKDNCLLIDYDKILLYFENNYSSSYIKNKFFIKNIIETHLNLKNTNPNFVFMPSKY